MKNPLHAPSVSITQLDFDSDVYLNHIDLSLMVETHNLTAVNDIVHLGFSILSPTNHVIDFPVHPLSLKDETSQGLSLSYSLEDLQLNSLISGSYDAVIAFWDRPLSYDSPSQLDRVEINDAFRLYNTHDSFKTIDTNVWYSRNGRLGRTELSSSHVSIVKNKLTITHPAGTLEGGEIQTIDLQHYGSYEICMKLPLAPSSITGFFLYSPPDFYHEIDIELFNQVDSEIWLTSYLDGSVYHEDKMALDFDPTADFHKYRIDYYPHKVTFYIDGNPLKSWKDGFTQKPMQLMVNSWFPTWLSGKHPKADQLLQINWIRY